MLQKSLKKRVEDCMKSVAATVVAAAAARVTPFIFIIYNKLSILLGNNIIVRVDPQFFQEPRSHL
jgi:uncharacterized protein (DUF2062 family)